MFYDRIEAGEKLAERLGKFQSKPNAIVMALIRGGIIIGEIVAGKLDLPLDIVIAKKIRAPENEELAIGAVAEEGEPILNEELIGTAGITANYLDLEISQAREKIKEQTKLYRGNKVHNLPNKTIILVDDGVATGKTLEAAISYLKSKKVKNIIVATPVIAQETLTKLKKQIEKIIYLEAPVEFFAVGQFYENFPQITDEEVKKILVNNRN